MRALAQARDPRRERLLIHAILALVAVLFSVHYIVGKIALRSFQPLTFAYLRVLGSAICLLILTGSRKTSSLLARTRPEVVDLYGGFDVDAFVAATGRLTVGVRHYTSLVPTQLRRLLAADADLTTYDAVLVGGAALSPDVHVRASDAGVRVVTTYGMTETCGGCVYDGMALDGVDVMIGADGRVLVAGPVLFAGYRLRPDLTSAALADGRHITQDLGAWSADGRLEVRGRADDVIQSGGVTVPAAMVERVLLGHPEVAACAVVGRPDPEWGERVVAVVQPREWAAAPTINDLRAFAADHLEPAALPREVVLMGQLPVLDSGKPDKAAVRGVLPDFG